MKTFRITNNTSHHGFKMQTNDEQARTLVYQTRGKWLTYRETLAFIRMACRPSQLELLTSRLNKCDFKAHKDEDKPVRFNFAEI